MIPALVEAFLFNRSAASSKHKNGSFSEIDYNV